MIIILGVVVLMGLLTLRHLFRVRTGAASKLDPWHQLERAMKVWSLLPTAQAQFTVGSLCILATATRYVLSSDHPTRGGAIISTWEPSEAWLLFLAALMGISTAHGIGKRMTDRDYASTVAAAKAGQPPSQPGA